MARAKGEADKTKAALAALAKTFTAEELGQGHKKGGTKLHLGRRINMLNRLKLRSPPLPPHFEADWGDFVTTYAKYEGSQRKAAVGVTFITEIQGVMADLGEHLQREKGDAHVEGGRQDALAEFMRLKLLKMTRAATSLRV